MPRINGRQRSHLNTTKNDFVSPSSSSHSDNDDDDQQRIDPSKYACLPASLTKHLETLSHPLPSRPEVLLKINQISASTITQDESNENVTAGSTSTGTTGTTLWLGGQVMACYIADVIGRGDHDLTKSSKGESREAGDGSGKKKRKRVIELGGGVGYLALVLASIGYDIVTTDIKPSLDTVLRPNISHNSEIHHSWPSIAIQELDWSTFGDGSNWMKELNSEGDSNIGSFDLIITTDTIYTPTLIIPLLSTLRSLSLLIPSKPTPPIYVAIESRDPTLNAQAISQAKTMGFVVKKISSTRVRKAVEKGGKWGWDKALRKEWEGVEIWRWRLEV